MMTVSTARFTPTNGGKVIVPHFAHWRWQEDMRRRERLASSRFAAACAAHHKGAYRHCMRFIEPLLAASPQSIKMQHWIKVLEARLNDPSTPTLRDARQMLTDIDPKEFSI